MCNCQHASLQCGRSCCVIVSMLASSVVDRGVIVSMLASSVVDRGVIVSMLASSVVDRGV
jgi:hypothetical protein